MAAMAKQFTGIDGALLVDGVKVAKVSDWSFDGSVNLLETTTLGDYARNYVSGIQQFNGSAKLFYYENAANKIEGSALMDDVLRTTQTPTEPTHTMELQLNNGAQARKIAFKCALNQVQVSASAGEIIEASVSFTVCGPLTTVTMV